MPKRLGDLVPGVGRDVELRGVAARAQEVQPGDLFVLHARAGARAQRFAALAEARGAAAILLVGDLAVASRLPVVRAADEAEAAAILARFHEVRGQTRHLAVVGTDGKTSVAWYLRALLDRVAGPAWSRGTLGVVRSEGIEPRPNTTPGLVEAWALIGEAERRGVRWLIWEVSSHGIAQRRLAGIRWQGVVWTTLGRDHAEDHGGVEATWRIKAGFVSEVAVSGGVIAVNADDPEIMQRAPKGAWRYGREHADLSWQAPKPGVLRVRWSEGEAEIAPIPRGGFHAENIAAAVLLAWKAAGIPPQDAARALAGVSPPPGRLEPVAEGVFIDYAHTPEALRRMLEDARRLATRRVLLVFGCGGERDRGKRAPMGAVAAQLADQVWITNDNPRGESPEAIARDILAGVPAHARARVRVVLDRAKAIAEAVDARGEGDVLVIAGKGAESTMEVAGRVIPWSDAEAVRRAMGGKACASPLA
ncbi:MAG: UDP-N-acetylmuramoyl-L-alanyl-D-glutamate--2,6-diaminopimelate ligase [Zetaproteobacteria bacterium]|nr:MAG: UDP-N-acetylmuramoyl-L-alanyl-D-glutamate--2,6-diaminopimelate ligase [Zetaproteobacteria bacterium]